MKQLLTTLLIFSHLITATEIKEATDPLLTLINTQAHFSSELTHWEVIIKEKISSMEIYQEIIADWTDEKEIQQRVGHQPGVIIHEMTQQQDGITVSQQLISTGDELAEAERIIVIEGEYFDFTIQKEYERIRDEFFAQINMGNSRTFTCIRFIDDGTIVNESVLKHFTSELEVLHSEMQDETIEKSMVKKEFFGYTPLWKQNFIIGGQKYNLQIAIVEQADKKLEYTIGTPILMNEY